MALTLFFVMKFYLEIFSFSFLYGDHCLINVISAYLRVFNGFECVMQINRVSNDGLCHFVDFGNWNGYSRYISFGLTFL